MSIVISDLNMPAERESFNLTIKYNGTVFDTETGIQVAEAHELPAHGRLIDADAYESLLRGLGDRNYRREKGTICDAIKFLHPYYAPTIIQASEVGE